MFATCACSGASGSYSGAGMFLMIARFVLRKALEAKLPVILCVNKVDRPDARIEEVVGEASDLLLGLAQDVIEEGKLPHYEYRREPPLLFSPKKY